jgi:hydroxylamine reductase
MEQLWNELLGAVIGLARASEGNEADLTEETHAALLAGLSATPGDGEAALSSCIDRIHAEKKRLIPNCYACAMPCGRTSDYQMEDLRLGIGSGPALRALMLAGLRSAAPGLQRAGYPSEDMVAVYRSLISVGLDGLSADFLLDIAAEAGRLSQKYL